MATNRIKREFPPHVLTKVKISFSPARGSLLDGLMDITDGQGRGGAPAGYLDRCRGTVIFS